MDRKDSLLDLFEGKLVSFSSAQDTLAIKNINLKRLEGRLFIVGLVPKGATTNNWAADRACAIAWDQVIDYMIFDSETQYLELMAKSGSDS